MKRERVNDTSAQTEAKKLHDIIKASRMVMSPLDRDRVLQKILLYACELGETPAGSVALFDVSSSTMTLHAAIGLSDKFIARGSWNVNQSGLTRTILDRRELLVLSDTRESSFFNNPLILTEAIRALIAVPLWSQDQVVGILYLNDFKPRNFDPEICEKLVMLASFASLSITTALLRRKSSQLPATDSLTGLFNHRQFKRVLSQEVARAKRYKLELSLIKIDIDDFRQFNNLYGHPCGDRVLSKVAALLVEVFRGVDLVFRYAGEEFVILLPQSGPAEAAIAAERAREAVSALRIASRGVSQLLGVTVSIGVASLPVDGITGVSLLDAADRLIDEAKYQGNDCVHTAKTVKRS